MFIYFVHYLWNFGNEMHQGVISNRTPASLQNSPSLCWCFMCGCLEEHTYIYMYMYAWVCQSSRCCSSHVEVGIALYGSMMTFAQRMIMATSSRQRKAMQARVRPWSTSTKAGSAVPSTSMTAAVCCCCPRTRPHTLLPSWRPDWRHAERGRRWTC